MDLLQFILCLLSSNFLLLMCPDLCEVIDLKHQTWHYTILQDVQTI